MVKEEKMTKEKMTKLTMEFETFIQSLSGEDAQKWLEAANGIIVLNSIRAGIDTFPTFDWKREEKKDPSVWAKEIAAQLWCRDDTAKNVMNPELCLEIARLIDKIKDW
jgi:hypothetical protein